MPNEVVDQAIEWSIRVIYNPADEPTRLAFEHWLGAAETHRVAWARLQSLGGRFDAVPAGLTRMTLEKLPKARLQRRQALKLLSLLGATGLAGWATQASKPWHSLMADFDTRVGEHRQWALADGSLLELNTNSAVRALFHGQVRTIELLRGELYLISGKDTASPVHRPLRVATPVGQFEALGTRFNVRLYDQACRLGVTEGAVRMQPSAGESTIAHAGEIWELNSHGVQRQPGIAAEAASWVDGLLTARNMPLADVLAEFSRYRTGYLGCAADIGQRPVTGNFNLSNIDTTLAFLAQAQGLRLHSLTRYWVRLSA
ncbi:FecR domain-containing protein [Pseudomonas sp. KNUC1026]|uniref:FecR domain-containing protein n=1 Tax=Pseudomonas sp. KNUC1026 TaxID=2893890 RepID=UPI001F450017|nr:FecR family protein [Pseudomonas sp. KNUC1026]UFH51111.1 FecR family protein [Pseudomonas sp. KNUC1026]